jgi:hypothetical protein
MPTRNGHHGWDRPPPAPAGTFTTAPSEREAFTLTAFGDQASVTTRQAPAALVNAHSSAFHLPAGDPL